MKLTGTEKKNLGIAAALTVFLVIIDQWVKVLALHGLRGQPGYSYFGNFVKIEYAENRGAFLSLGANLSDEMRTWIFVVGVCAILLFCIYSLWQSRAALWPTISFALVISGGIGNLIDRVRQGYVIDYIHMGFSGFFRTGVFNIADVAISGGLLLLVYFQYRQPAEKDAS
jgi:signal peptidase II